MQRSAQQIKMKTVLMNFGDNILSRQQMKNVLGGTRHICTEYFTTGGTTYTNTTTTYANDCQTAESQNTMCNVNGTTCTTSCNRADEA